MKSSKAPCPTTSVLAAGHGEVSGPHFQGWTFQQPTDTWEARPDLVLEVSVHGGPAASPGGAVGMTEEEGREGRGAARPWCPGKSRLLGWGHAKEADVQSAYFMVLSGDEAICSFNVVRDTGRIFFIWVMILELFQKLE